MSKCLQAQTAADYAEDELLQIRGSGVAIDLGEVSPALRAVAVPIRDVGHETVAALGMWTMAARWPKIDADMARALHGTAARIERSLRGADAKARGVLSQAA